MSGKTSQSSGTTAIADSPPRTSRHVNDGRHEESIPIKILIVDDEPKNLVALGTVLDDARYRLVQAQSADEALLFLIKEEFALIILDVHMPGMSGFELAQLIKQRKRTASIPIIFLTAYYNEDQYVLEGYETGAVDYLLKPVNPAILRSKVAVYAELFQKSHELMLANRALFEEVEERRKVQQELVKLNDQLEQRVEERAADLNRVATELTESDRRKDQFLAMLAHELRNPLAPIRNAVEILRMRPDDSNAVRSAASIMDRQIAQLVRLVDDLLDVSRISRGKIELRRKRTDLRTALAEAVESIRPQTDSFRQALEVQLPGQPTYIDVDPTRLSQIVGNLLHNASKFTPENGRITLSVTCEEPHAVIRVMDTGIGIQTEEISRIFELFVQGDTSLERAQSGLGIGLTLVKQLVEMHGGTINVQSDGNGKGAEFTVRFPVAGSPPENAVPPEPAVNRSPNNFGRVLVVDDNADAAKLLARLLSLHGNVTCTAFDGLEALDVAPKFQPNVILLDIGLPKLNGYDTARRIRQTEWGGKVALIALTGWGSPEDRRRSSEAGFDGHLVKPVEFTQLTGMLANLLAPA